MIIVRLATSLMIFSDNKQMHKIKSIDVEVSKYTNLFSLDVQLETKKEVKAMTTLLNSLNDPVIRFADDSRLSRQVSREKEHLGLLRWLSSIPYVSHHKRHSNNRMPSSCGWFLRNTRYTDWRRTSESSIFLLHGIMGSGKSALTSAVVDSILRESDEKLTAAPVAYFYCSKNQAEIGCSKPEEILRSVLRQLALTEYPFSSVHASILEEYDFRQAEAKADGFEMTRLLVADCVRLILGITAANPATIVIDAVDEIEPEFRHVLSTALTQITRDSLNVVKIFLSTRYDSNISVLFPDVSSLAIRKQHTAQDMETYVHQEIARVVEAKRLLNGVVSKDLVQDLQEALLAGAEEM